LSSVEKVTIPSLIKMKKKGKKIAMITAYDYPTALLVDRAGVDIVLVGDSLGMVVLGYESTIPVTLEDVIHHTKAVSRAVKRALVVADMPFMTFNVGIEEAIRNAGRLIKEGGAEAVKLEGGEEVKHVVEALVDAGIPVMGHIGLTPQRIAMYGGYHVRGKSVTVAKNLLEMPKPWMRLEFSQ